jgi:acetyl-CoA acetyltransferase
VTATSRRSARIAEIAGAGEVSPQEDGWEDSLHVAAQACRLAVSDAGLEHKDVDGLVTGYSLTDPYPFFSSALSERLGLDPLFQQTVTLGGATGVAMLQVAAMAVESGTCSRVLVVWGDRRRRRGDGAVRDRFTEIALHPTDEAPSGATIPAMYALAAARYLHDHCATPEDLAEVVVHSRRAAALTERATRRDLMTVEQVLAARTVARPLTVPQCALVGDFGVAFVLTRPEALPSAGGRPRVAIRGFGQSTTHEYLSTAPTDLTLGAGRAIRRAMARAGTSLSDLDFAELYDCFSVTTLLLIDALGLSAPGRAAELLRSGRLSHGGELPVNTHGGLLSYGAGGGSLVVEAVRQLQGHAGAGQVEGASTALVHNLGGILSLHASAVLESY